MSQFQTFGQELYFKESLAAIKLASELKTRDELRKAIMRKLRQASSRTRLRVAEKIMQRFIATEKNEIVITPFIKLVNGSSDPRAQAELLLYQLVQTDRIVEAIASEIFYPYFILNRMPKGFTASDFRMINRPGLFEWDRVITGRFVSLYAQKNWNFTSQTTIFRALRILKQSGLLQALPGESREIGGLSFIPSPHLISLPTFAYCLHHEFSQRRLATVALDQIQNARFARLFLLQPLQVTALLGEAQRHKLVRREKSARGGRFSLPSADPDKLVANLLSPEIQELSWAPR